MKPSTWKCPTCKRWVAEMMSIRCAACRIILPPVRVVDPEPEEPVAPPVVAPEPVVAEPVREAVVATRGGGCAICGERHWSVERLRARVREGKIVITPKTEPWYTRHGISAREL